MNWLELYRKPGHRDKYLIITNREVDEVPTKDYSCMKQIITRFVFKYIKLK
jgi:hypothetical protein